MSILKDAIIHTCRQVILLEHVDEERWVFRRVTNGVTETAHLTTDEEIRQRGSFVVLRNEHPVALITVNDNDEVEVRGVVPNIGLEEE